MIITIDELPLHSRAVTMVDGCFDPIHVGHVKYFESAYALGFPVLCCVETDSHLRHKHSPLLSQCQRAYVLDAIKYIAYTLINPSTTARVLELLRPKYYVKGKDWEGKLKPEETSVCGKLGIEIVFTDTMHGSSTEILAKYMGQSET